MTEIFQRIDSGQLLSMTSAITLVEVLARPIQLGEDELVERYKALLTEGEYFELVEIDNEIAGEAARLRAKYQLRTPDAIQVAAALISGCEAFLTNDIRLRKISELSILILDEMEL